MELSPAEFNVLRLISKGYTDEEIGKKLNIQPKSVTTYVNKVGRRWGIRGRVAILHFANEHAMLIEQAVPETDWLQKLNETDYVIKSRPEFSKDKRTAFRDRRKKKRRK